MRNASGAERVLVEDGPPAKRLVVQLKNFEATRLLDMRYWYQDKKSGEFRPTAKGVSLTRKNFLTLKRVVDEQSEEILDWLSLSYVPAHVTEYEARQDAKLDELRNTAPPMEVSVEANRRSSAFFEVRHEGGKAEVVLNEAHPFISAFLDAASRGDAAATRELLAKLLLCHDRAADGLAHAATTHASVLLDQLEFDWGQMLKSSVKDA